MRLAILVLVTSIWSAAASAESVLCDVTRASRGLDKRIGDRIRIEFDSDVSAVRVWDGYPRPDEMPHRGKISRDTAKILSFTWTQPALAAVGGVDPMRLSLRLSIVRATGSGRISGQRISGNAYGATDSQLSGRARCRIAAS